MRRKKKNNAGVVFLSIFIALIMVTSILGYIFNDTAGSTLRYNGHKFTLSTSGWRTTIDGNSYFFAYSPKDVEDLNLSNELNFDGNMEIDLTYDLDSDHSEQMATAAFKLSEVAASKNIYLRQGFTKNNTFDAPIITCADATPFVPVIYLKESNVTGARIENNCIIIESRDENFYMAYTEMISYKLLGIM